MVLLLIAVVALVIANGFFVASEFALARTRPTQVEEWQAQGRRGAGSVRHGIDHLDAYLAACQLGITLASIGLGFVGKPAFQQLLAPLTEPLGGAIPAISAYAISFFFAFSIVTVLHVVYGELAPKSMAIARTEFTVLRLAPILRAFYTVSRPLVDTFNWMGNMTLRPFGVESITESGRVPHSVPELRSILRASAEGGHIHALGGDLAEMAVLLQRRDARDLMVPSGDMAALPAEASVADAARAVTDSGHARIPVLDAEGHPTGLVTAIDVLDRISRGHADGDLSPLLRPIEVVPESANAIDVLATLRRQRQRLALVANEYGSIIGLLSIEDIIEEIVGELYDEFDAGIDPDDPERLRALPDGGWSVPGDFPVGGMESVGVELPEGDYATVSGLVTDRLGRICEVGDTVAVPGWHLKVTETGNNVAARVEVLPAAASDDDDD